MFRRKWGQMKPWTSTETNSFASVFPLGTYLRKGILKWPGLESGRSKGGIFNHEQHLTAHNSHKALSIDTLSSSPDPTI